MPRNAYGELEIILRRTLPEIYDVELSVTDSANAAKAPSARGTAKLSLPALLELHRDPQKYGQLLAEQLFCDPKLKDFYQTKKAAFQSRGWKLRIQIRIDPSVPELRDLRWELLHDPETNLPMATSERLLISRFLPSRTDRVVTLRPKDQLKALIAVASPSDWDALNLAEVVHSDEVNLAREGLAGIQTAALEAKVPLTLDRLIEGIRQDIDILYLVCHGTFPKGKQAHLCLQDKYGHAEFVPISKLIERFQDLSDLPRLIVLASCKSAAPCDGVSAHSSLAPLLAEEGVPAIVAMQDNISMETIQIAMPVFFRELIEDGRIDRAMAVARGDVRGRSDYWMPALFLSLKEGVIYRADVPPPTSRLSALALLFPTALIATLILAFSYVPMATRVDIEAVVNGISVTTDAAKEQQVVFDKQPDATSLALKGFREVRFTPRKVFKADPARLNFESNQYPEDAWKEIPVGGEFVLTPNNRPEDAQIMLEPLKNSGNLPVGPFSAFRNTGVTLSISEPGDLSLSLRAKEEQKGSIELPNSFTLELSSCSTNSSAMPNDGSTVRLRVELPDPSEPLQYKTAPSGTSFFPKFAAKRDLSLFSAEGLDVTAVDFSTPGIATPERQSTIEGTGKFAFEGHPRSEAVPFAAKDWLILNQLQNFKIANASISSQDRDRGLLHLKLSGTAGVLRSGKQGFIQDRRLSALNVAWHDRKLIALFAILLLWLAPTVIAGRRFLQSRWHS